MSSFDAYGRLEKAIAAADVRSIRARWEYARRLLVDRTKTTRSGNLRNGVIEGLIAAAGRQGIKISRREIQHRIKAAKQYPSEAHITHVRARFETWHKLREAGFPPVQLPLGADTTPYDPRTPEEEARDAGEAIDRIGQGASGQLKLFEYFKESVADELSTIAELRKYAVDMSEWTSRQARKDRERLAYIDRLSAAVGGDESKTWAEANAALVSQAGASLRSTGSHLPGSAGPVFQAHAPGDAA